MLLPRKLVLDTSVLVEYIIARSPYRNIVEEIFAKARRRELELYVNTITLAETLYTATRIYKVANIENPNEEAENFITWIITRAKVINIDKNTSIHAGELKKKLRIALPDCFVIASARRIGGKALFKKIEAEMRNVIEELRELGVIFLEEIYKL